MNSKEFFDTYGKGAVIIYSYGFRDEVAVEDLYQCFKERLLLEMTEEKGCE